MEPDNYHQAKIVAAFFPIEQAGFIQVTGPDRAAFLQRQTTNNIPSLTPSSSLYTVLTSPTARILDVLIVFNEPTGETLALLPLPGRAARSVQHLRSRIFFMDK